MVNVVKNMVNAHLDNVVASMVTVVSLKTTVKAVANLISENVIRLFKNKEKRNRLN